jgi:hypothetical protein
LIDWKEWLVGFTRLTHLVVVIIKGEGVRISVGHSIRVPLDLYYYYFSSLCSSLSSEGEERYNIGSTTTATTPISSVIISIVVVGIL